MPETSAIDVSNLRFRYPGADRDAVRGLSMTVQRNEIFGLLGPSGAGKTTTQQIVTGLLPGYGGTVSVLGREVREWGHDLYDQIGISFELPAGYTRLTAHEDLSHFALLHATPPRDLDALLQQVGLGDARDHPVATMSKGMHVRLNLARALAHRPHLLFLDEPTSGLDPATARDVRKLILEERDAGATVVIATHDMTTAEQLCDRVAFVIDGTIAACDAPAALRLRGPAPTVEIRYQRDGQHLTRTFDTDPRGTAALADALTLGGLESVHSTEPTLDDVFVELTGQRL